MTDVAISQLPVAAASATTDDIPIVQNGVTKRITNALLFSTSLATASGLPIDAGTTGTLPVLRGGTGTTTSTGTGSVVLSDGPALSTATIGLVNKVSITAPASNATLTIANTKTLVVSNTLTLAGTDGKTMTFPATDASIARTDAAQTFTGLQTFTTGIVAGVQTLSGPGAISLTTLATAFSSTAAGNALTLADGTVGQMKIVAYVAQTAGPDTGVLTPTTAVGYTTITFNKVEDTIMLMFFTQGWAVIGGNGAVVV